RDIRARNQQNKSHRAEKQAQGWTNVAAGLLRKRLENQRERGIGIRESGRQPACDAVHFNLRLRAIDTRSQACESSQRASAAIPDGGCQIVRSPHFSLRDPERREIKRRRHDADDGVRIVIEKDLLANDVLRSPKASLPQTVSDNQDVVLARREI